MFRNKPKQENEINVILLRVLMLGKNYIRKIEKLESVKKLDVLDLHSNRISKVDKNHFYNVFFI